MEKRKTLGRRDFLRLLGLSAGATVAAACVSEEGRAEQPSASVRDLTVLEARLFLTMLSSPPDTTKVVDGVETDNKSDKVAGAAMAMTLGGRAVESTFAVNPYLASFRSICPNVYCLVDGKPMEMQQIIKPLQSGRLLIVNGIGNDGPRLSMEYPTKDGLVQGLPDRVHFSPSRADRAVLGLTSDSPVKTVSISFADLPADFRDGLNIWYARVSRSLS